MFIYFPATLCSSGTAGGGHPTYFVSTSCFEACHNQMLLFWGTRPAVCLLPCLILIQGDNPPGPTCLICELLTLHEVPKQSLCPWIAGIFMAESRGLEHNAHFWSSMECGCGAHTAGDFHGDIVALIWWQKWPPALYCRDIWIQFGS